MTAIAPADYIQIKLFCAITGYTEDAVNGKIARGVWREGVHYRRAPDRHILMHLPSYYLWAEHKQQAA